jgi:hypothetical protein
MGLIFDTDEQPEATYVGEPLQPDMVVVRNNIFAVVDGGADMMMYSVPTQYNNLFSPGAPMSFGDTFVLGESSIEASDLAFTQDWRPTADSPTVDMGSPDAVKEWTDYDGNPVPCGDGPDIGASELCD